MSAMASRLSLISFVSVLNGCALVVVVAVVEEGVAVVELLVEVDVEVEDVVSGDQKLARGCVVIVDGRMESSVTDRGRRCRVIKAAIILLLYVLMKEKRIETEEMRRLDRYLL